MGTRLIIVGSSNGPSDRSIEFKSLPANPRPCKLLFGAKLSEGMLQFLIRARVKIWNSLQQRRHSSQGEVLRVYTLLQILRLPRQRDCSARLRSESNRTRNSLLQ